MADTKQNNYTEFIKNNKIVKSTVNRLYRFLVLWIIKYNDEIHGYGIMKELDKFFEHLIDEGVMKKSNPMRIELILLSNSVGTSILKRLRSKRFKYPRNLTRFFLHITKYKEDRGLIFRHLRKRV